MGRRDEYEEAKQNYDELWEEARENERRANEDPEKWSDEEELRHVENMRAWNEE